ncbi:HD family phosphohydrolase [bacterium SCSIO 12696]|nr:HD family phosphohydrolase [bacterium SCSIO 12696]
MNACDPGKSIAQIRELFEEYGERHYGEACTQLEHAISCAQHAVQSNMPEHMVIAALLHDIGHFVADRQGLPGFDQWGYAAHDSLGANYLQSLGFGKAVTEPIRLHVAAKRYQATLENTELSVASSATLQQQGGTMSNQECQQFKSHPWANDALRLRQLDDTGKPDKLENTNIEPWLERAKVYLRASQTT